MRITLATLFVVAQLFWVNFPREWLLGQLQRSRPALPVAQLPARTLALGVYDPIGTFKNTDGIAIEQVFAPWRPDTTREVVKLIHSVRQRSRTPLVGLEPWPFNTDGMTQEMLFPDIVAGKYDAPIDLVCKAAAAEAPQEILLRWAHEMDLTGHHPWAQGIPEAFIPAYRHVVDMCRAIAPNVRFVWSPAGNWEAGQYWPGDDYVDYVGVTTLAFRDWELFRGEPAATSFQRMFDRRLQVVGGFGKPIIVCEFGVQGDADYKAKWIDEAFSAIAKYPEIRAVVYFNAVDPFRWDEYDVPDWRVPPTLFPPAPFAPAQAARSEEAPQAA